MKRAAILLSGILFFSINTVIAQMEIPTPQQLADEIRADNVESFKSLYTHESIAGIDPVSGLHLFHLAAKEGRAEIVKFILIQEQSMEMKPYGTREMKPPMIHAIENGHLNVVKVLLNNGRRRTKGNWMGTTYLEYANYYNQPQIKQYLIEQGALKGLQANRRTINPDNLPAEARTIAESWNEQAASRLNLLPIQLDKVKQVNYNMARYMADITAKYQPGTADYNREVAEIDELRRKKLYAYLSQNQIAKL